MDIPQSVLEFLKCDECDEFLSCGPVFVIHETDETVCGRCKQEPESDDSTKCRDKTRNNKYEAVAKLLRFPCTNAKHGCPEKMDFSEDEPNSHELNCEFRSFCCPMVPRGECDWIGSCKSLKTHCKDKHNTQVLENPCNPPKPDITTSNLNTYLISAFHFLFLLHVKCCAASGKLFHSIRMFGNTKFLTNFSFNLIVEGNNMYFSKVGSILPAGLLTIQEPTAICTGINGLLEILDGKYNESKLTIQIQELVKYCLNCSIENVRDSKFCNECESKVLKCKFHEQGCSFVDVNQKKCVKHEDYYCQYQTKCCRCSVNFISGSLIEHLMSSVSCRKTSTVDGDLVINIKSCTDSNYSYILLFTNSIGTIICYYFLLHSKFELWLHTPLPSYELKYLNCSITLIDPQTKYSEIITPQLIYNGWSDFYINLKMDNFPSWENSGLDINIKIDMN